MSGAEGDRTSAAAPVDGQWETGQSRVWWRVGTAPADERPGDVARRWVEEVVRSRALFTWRGFVTSPPYAKPRFAAASPWDFSVSHSGRTVLVGITMGARIGVDVENAPYTAFQSATLRARMLSPVERSILRSLPAEETHACLARIWTAKEAQTKATGHGQKTDFRRFSVPIVRTARPQPFEACIATVSGGHRRFLRLSLPAHLSSSAAAQAPSRRPAHANEGR